MKIRYEWETSDMHVGLKVMYCGAPCMLVCVYGVWGLVSLESGATVMQSENKEHIRKLFNDSHVTPKEI